MDPDYKWIRTVNRFKNLGSGADLAEFTVKNITVFAAEKLYFVKNITVFAAEKLYFVKNITVFAAEKLYFANFFDFTWA